MKSFSLIVITVLVVWAAGCAPATQNAIETDPTLYPEPAANAVTFWGHATNYIDLSGFGVITDPVFETSYSPFHGRQIPQPPRDSFDQTRVILISHAHHDHLHPKTLRRFADDVVILCPEPAVEYLDQLGNPVLVMRPGDEYEIPGGRIIAVPAHHPGGRLSLTARHDGRALGYIIETERETIYYSGDTELFPGLAVIGERYQPDIAILNINSHLNSEDALLAIEALGNPQVIPSHFGAYGGSNAQNSAIWRAELIENAGGRVKSLAVGESLLLEQPDFRISRAANPSRAVQSQ